MWGIAFVECPKEISFCPCLIYPVKTGTLRSVLPRIPYTKQELLPLLLDQIYLQKVLIDLKSKGLAHFPSHPATCAVSQDEETLTPVSVGVNTFCGQRQEEVGARLGFCHCPEGRRQTGLFVTDSCQWNSTQYSIEDKAY